MYDKYPIGTIVRLHDDKENDHTMDDVRYYCYTFLIKRLRWMY